jgi:hypothetical protein
MMMKRVWRRRYIFSSLLAFKLSGDIYVYINIYVAELITYLVIKVKEEGIVVDVVKQESQR